MAKPLDPEHPGKFSSSLVVGLAMLAYFSAEHPTCGIADMAEGLGVSRPTTHRYASTLVTLGYLERTFSRKYRLAAPVSNFGLSVLNSMSVRRVAHESLRELRDRTGRTVSLWVLSDGGVRCIDRWHGSLRGQVAVDEGIGLGTRLPVHCTAAGKALLAHLPVAEQREAIAELRLVKRGPKTIATKTALRAELERVLTWEGVAVEDEELLTGRRAVAAAVEIGEGAAVAVELTVPASAYTCEQLLDVAPREVAAHVVRELGLVGGAG
jgi:DNA-binding IclR family transcriptional regulator